MKVIFLDVDGVLNSSKDKFSMSLETDRHLIYLKRIVDATDAVVVLSSSWRKISSLRKALENRLRSYDIEIIDSTKSLPGTRGSEIKEWLSRNPDVESFVILDDDSDMDEYKSTNLVKTEYDEGLKKEHIEKAVSILNNV